MKRKWLAIGIILLFIGTSVIPLTAQKATEKPSSQMNILSNSEFVLKSNCENKLNTVDCEMGGLVDEVNVRCRGPYIIEILERNSVFRITYSHTYNGYLTISEFVNVTKRDGTLLFSDTKTDVIPNDYSLTWQYWAFPEFKDAHFLFGYFYVNVRLFVENDQSSKIIRIPGFIFGISVIILDHDGTVISS